MSTAKMEFSFTSFLCLLARLERLLFHKERIGQPTLVGLTNRVFYTSQEQIYKHRIAWLVILRQRRIIKWTTRRRTCGSVPTSADCFGSRGVDSDTAGRWARPHRLYKEATPDIHHSERIGQPTLVGLNNRVFHTSHEQNYKHRIAWLVILRQRRIIKLTTRRRTCASVPTSADCFGSRGVDSDTAGRWARPHRLYKEATPDIHHSERIGQPTLVGLANRVFCTSQEQNYKHRIAWLVILRQRRIIKWTMRRRTCASVPTSADSFGS
ncbi:hypothetical protein MRX96_045501 [Rhipicephalus microplus]